MADISHHHHYPKRLIVIGAGMSGIKLAHSCLDDELQDLEVTIVEANSHVGGRMRPTQFCDHTVELGANWISGLETRYQNPIWKLAQSVNLQGQMSDRTDDDSSIRAFRHGKEITQEYLESVDRFMDIYETAVKHCQDNDITPQNDKSVRSILEELGWKESTLSDIDRLVEFNVLEVWVVDGLERLSAAHNMEQGANDVDLGQEEFFVQDERGFNCILNDMVKDIQTKGAKICFNSKVVQVRYEPGNVGVTVQDTQTGKVSEYKADAIACTVSLGVLQSGQIEFVPPLPDWKLQALKEMKMFTFAKVFIEMPPSHDDDFWSGKKQFIICSDRRGYYPLWMKYNNSSPKNLFMCYLGGSEAERVESLTEEQLKNEIQEHFWSAFQNDNGNAGMFRPISVKVTDWSKNARFCGSYSVLPLGAFASVPQTDLTRPLPDGRKHNTLYFAGEALDDKFNGWVQGAYRSGERVAKSIMGVTKDSC